MSHQPARVVTVACLVAASLAAQAPNAISSSAAALPAHGGGSRAGRSLDADTAESWAPRRWQPAPLADEFLVPQDDPQGTDYSPGALFQNAHGAFMADRSRFEPMISLEASLFPNQGVRHEPGSFDLLQYGFDANFPFVIGDGGYVLLGAYAHTRSYKFTTPTTLADENVHALGLKFGVGAFLDQDLLLEVEARPGVWSDCDGGLHHQDFDVPAHALLTWRTVDGLYWKGGIRYNQIFEDAPWLPYLGMSWNITQTMMPGGEGYETGTWRLDVLLPEYAELSYWPTADTGFQFGAEIDGAEYHVRTPFATGRQRANLRVQEFTTYLGVTHRFSDTFSLQGRVGAAIAGDYDLTNGYAGFDRVEGALDQGFFATVSFGIDW